MVPLLREPLDVVLPPGHPLARHRRLRLAQLADEPWISAVLRTSTAQRPAVAAVLDALRAEATSPHPGAGLITS